MAEKRCTYCLQIKDEGSFGKAKRGLLGRRSRCYECAAAIKREKVAENPEKFRESLRRSYAKHRDRRKLGSKSWYLRNREHALAIAKARREADPELERLRVRKANWKLRTDMIAAYGGRCVCCDEAEPRFLTLDHINGDGKLHRATVGLGNVLRDLKKRGWPQEGFRLLCWNCHMAITHHGACPHHSAEPEVKGE